MAPSDSTTETGTTLSAAFADAGDLQPLVKKIHRIAQDLDELQSLITQKRQYILHQLSGIILLTREQAAEQVAMSTSQLDRAIRKGELPRIMIDRKPRFAVADIQVYIDSRRATGSRRRGNKKPQPLSHQ